MGELSLRSKLLIFIEDRERLVLFLGLALASVLAVVLAKFGIAGITVVMGLALMSLYLLSRGFSDAKLNLFLLVVFGSYLAFPILARIVGQDILGRWQFIVFGFCFIGLLTFIRACRANFWLMCFLIFTALFLSTGLISTLYGRSHKVAAAYQIFSDLKPLFMILFGFAVVWNDRTQEFVWRIVHWFWLPALIFVAWEWVSPSSYFHLFTKPGEPSPDPTGVFPSRAIGLFEHPGMLANFCADMILLTVVGFMTQSQSRLRYALLFILYVIIMICSVQRQELVNIIICVGFILILARPERIKRNISIVIPAGFLLFSVFWVMYADNIEMEIAGWGIGNGAHVEMPRAQLVIGGVEVANRYFPLGAGLGTYGGAGAKNYDLSLHEDLGFDNYWWFKKEDYLMDTYWPNPMAETGYFGAVFLLLSYLCLLIYPTIKAIKASEKSRPYWLATAAGVLYMLMLSFSSPAFQDPRLFFIPALLFGWSYSKEKNVAENE